jgi:hypothetical protein
MLTAEELDEMKQYVLYELPHILEQDPQFVLFIEGIINEKFPRRDEFARLLDEFTSFRKETQSNFDRVDQDISDLRQEVKQDISVLSGRNLEQKESHVLWEKSESKQN